MDNMNNKEWIEKEKKQKFHEYWYQRVNHAENSMLVVTPWAKKILDIT